MSSIYDQIGDAKVSGGGSYFQTGLYPIIWIEAVKEVENSDKHKCIAIECHIIQSEVDKQPRGTEVSAFANLTKHGKSAPGNVRKWLAQISGLEVEDVDAEGAKAAVSSDNPFNGTLCVVRGKEILTKEKRLPFTVVDFERLPEDVQANAKQLHADAGFGAF